MILLLFIELRCPRTKHEWFESRSGRPHKRAIMVGVENRVTSPRCSRWSRTIFGDFFFLLRTPTPRAVIVFRVENGFFTKCSARGTFNRRSDVFGIDRKPGECEQPMNVNNVLEVVRINTCCRLPGGEKKKTYTI
uniref:Uncharacterized protein n=1 Tax=Sipha flava TaxID=143950 RepID=A0A2S2R7E0_9HEMI